MAYGNRNSNSSSAPRENKPPTAASLDYPEIASEYGIDKALWYSLKNLYPGGQDQSIVMVYEYCKARNLDPLKKPVHIVPMSVKLPGAVTSTMQDVIMPGIQEMRTTAARTREYAGVEPPKFGKLIDVETQNKGPSDKRGQFIEVPESCEITVYRLVQGKKYAFTHVEYFEEAVARNGYGEINAMWSKRPRGQLAKCAEAGGLRKAFPEELGGEYSADEMIGREAEDMPVLQGLPASNGASGVAGPEELDGPGASMDAAVEATSKALREPTLDAAVAAVGGVVSPDEPATTVEQKVDRVVEMAADSPAAAAVVDKALADAGSLTIDVPEGARRILNRHLEERGLTEADLLNKMGVSVTGANINDALGVLRTWA